MSTTVDGPSQDAAEGCVRTRRRRLSFGVFLQPLHHPSESLQSAMRRDVAVAKLAEEYGFDELWVGEHHNDVWETIASPELFLAHLAAQTSRIRLGTAVVLLALHHPVEVAERIALLDQISGGRAMLGVGPGAQPVDFKLFGLDRSAARARTAEAIDVITHLLWNRGQPYPRSGRFWDCKDAKLNVPPEQDRLPISTATSGSADSVALAGKYGLDALYSTQFFSTLPTDIPAAVGRLKAAGVGKVRFSTIFHLARDEESALDDIAEGAGGFFGDYGRRRGGENFVGPLDDTDRRAMIQRLLNRYQWPVGDWRTAGGRLSSRCDETADGLSGFVFLLNDWAPLSAVERSFELFATRLRPYLEREAQYREEAWSLVPQPDSGPAPSLQARP